jgi:hypothetical protein
MDEFQEIPIDILGPVPDPELDNMDPEVPQQLDVQEPIPGPAGGPGIGGAGADGIGAAPGPAGGPGAGAGADAGPVPGAGAGAAAGAGIGVGPGPAAPPGWFFPPPAAPAPVDLDNLNNWTYTQLFELFSKMKDMGLPKLGDPVQDPKCFGLIEWLRRCHSRLRMSIFRHVLDLPDDHVYTPHETAVAEYGAQLVTQAMTPVWRAEVSRYVLLAPLMRALIEVG